MSEQFGFEQIFRYRSTVYRDKRLVAPVARFVQTFRQQFLARPAGAKQHDRSIGIGHPLDHSGDFQHFRCPGDDLAQNISIAIASRSKRGVFLFEPVDVKGAPDDQPQFVDIHRLVVKVPCATRNGTQGTGFFTMARGNNNLGIRFQAQYLVHCRKPFGGTVGIRWQAEIEGHDIRLFGSQHLNRGFTVARDNDIKVVISPFKLLLQTGIIFDDQQLLSFRLITIWHQAALSSAEFSSDKRLARGRINVNRLPAPSALSTSRRPFIARASSRAS